MAYCVNIVRSLLNLLNLSTLPYFVFLEIQVLNFWYLFRNLRILLVFPFLIFSLHFRIFLILRFLMAEFHGIIMYQLHARIFLILCFLMFNFRHIFKTSFLHCLKDSLYLSYPLSTACLFFWIFMGFSYFGIWLSLSLC